MSKSQRSAASNKHRRSTCMDLDTLSTYSLFSINASSSSSSRLRVCASFSLMLFLRLVDHHRTGSGICTGSRRSSAHRKIIPRRFFDAITNGVRVIVRVGGTSIKLPCANQMYIPFNVVNVPHLPKQKHSLDSLTCCYHAKWIRDSVSCDFCWCLVCMCACLWCGSNGACVLHINDIMSMLKLMFNSYACAGVPLANVVYN